MGKLKQSMIDIGLPDPDIGFMNDLSPEQMAFEIAEFEVENMTLKAIRDTAVTHLKEHYYNLPESMLLDRYDNVFYR